MHPLALAIIGQLKAIGGSMRQDDWSADELHAIRQALREAAASVEARQCRLADEIMWG
jgi:hypothetical protein